MASYMPTMFSQREDMARDWKGNAKSQHSKCGSSCLAGACGCVAEGSLEVVLTFAPVYLAQDTWLEKRTKSHKTMSEKRTKSRENMLEKRTGGIKRYSLCSGRIHADHGKVSAEFLRILQGKQGI